MILILSTPGDQTTDVVINWLKNKKAECFRINDNDLLSNIQIHYELKNNSFLLNSKKLGKEFYFSKVKSIWFRKFGFYDNTNQAHSVRKFNSKELNSYLVSEYFETLDIITVALDNNDSNWLCNYKSVFINKTEVLLKANKIGLHIPNSLITNSRDGLIKFNKSNKQVITKSLKDGRKIIIDKNIYPLFTEEVNDKTIHNLPLRFSPSLVQEGLDKDYELRIFFLNKKCYSMALLSTSKDNSVIDIRRNNNIEKANRNVPYKLPDSIENKICLLMEELNLNTGSIDMIKTKDDRYVFLEVNPAGQFGNVSSICNYNLEEKVAEFLMK